MKNKSARSRMITSFIPWLGWLTSCLMLGVITIAGCSSVTTMNTQSTNYKAQLIKHQRSAVNLSGEPEKKALQRVSDFLQGIDSKDYINKNISSVYAEDSYLNDTLKSLKGREEIKQHFLKTSETMTSYKVTIDDISKSGNGYYIRWTMVYSAPKLAGGKPIESIGMSHILFDKEGKVLLHQDFWDSTSGLFEHLPILGGGIRYVKKRF